MAVVDRASGWVEDQVDQRLPVPGLEQPVLRRLLGFHSSLDERLESALGIPLMDEEVDVVLGRRSAARPGCEAAAQDVWHLGVPESGVRALHRVDQLGKVLGGRVGHGPAVYPGSRL